MRMSVGILSAIHGPADVHALDAAELPALCGEIRTTLVRYGHVHGGHIGSNLGMVEATVALHRVFDSPRDRIVFDVSHQSYVHKMLTGRAAAYLDPAHHDSVTGFTNPAESAHDQFVLGHTGTSISLACGLAKSRDLTGGMDGGSGIRNVIAVIGDGSLSSAIAFEGLNNAAEQGGNLIIIVNDNEMSIAEDHGGMYGTLARLRATGGKGGPNLFMAFGLDYRYVEAGNDVFALIEAFEQVKDTDHPVVVHIHTRKGLGLPPAKESAEARDSGIPVEGDAAVAAEDSMVFEGRHEANHWQDPDSTTGRPLGARKHYGSMAMAALEPRFATEPGLVVISPATPGSNGITRAFRERAGRHYVDTGIAEEHAVAFASGIARAGGRPVLATSATFFQRTFDQLQQELSLNGTPVTLLDFGGGLSGADNTHSGAFDIAMFGNIPGLTCLAPTSGRAFLDMLAWSTSQSNTSPVVIRVPGDTILNRERSGDLPGDAQDVTDMGSADDTCSNACSEKTTADGTATCPWSRYRTIRRGTTVAALALGNTLPLGWRVVEALASDVRHPLDATLIDPQQFSTLDAATLTELTGRHRIIVTLEDGQLEGGWGDKVTAFYANAGLRDMRVLNFGAAKEFTDRVPLDALNERYGMTVGNITARIRSESRG